MAVFVFSFSTFLIPAIVWNSLLRTFLHIQVLLLLPQVHYNKWFHPPHHNKYQRQSVIRLARKGVQSPAAWEWGSVVGWFSWMGVKHLRVTHLQLIHWSFALIWGWPCYTNCNHCRVTFETQSSSAGQSVILVSLVLIAGLASVVKFNSF